jgi:homoserine kinase
MFNVISIEESESLGISVTGQGERDLPRDESNLAYRAALTLYRAIGKAAPPLRLRLVNEVPLARGLGSSATAAVGALVAANALNGSPLSEAEILGLASRVEGHPDNVAAALHGGLVVAAQSRGGIECGRLPAPVGIRAVVFIPEFVMSTSQARAALPTMVSREDAVFNLSRSALLIAAFSTGRLDLLATATEDRLHQRYRQQMFPSMERFFDSARHAGACGAFLSGAGSTILAFVQDDGREVASAFSDVATQEGIAGRVTTLDLCNQGAEIIVDSR